MKRNRGFCDSTAEDCLDMRSAKRRNGGYLTTCTGAVPGEQMRFRQRHKLSPVIARETDFFDPLPDDLLLSILCKLISSVSCPSDFISIVITCKRLWWLGFSSPVLSNASKKMFAIKAKNWSDSAHRFLKLCADAGNVEACYTLGMIQFYCLQNRETGASLMSKAAFSPHAQALYSLAIIQFNGSGGSKDDKDLRAGVSLCAKAAVQGHIESIRELGHCLQDGYGIRQNVPEGRRFLVEANARELTAVLSDPKSGVDARAFLNWNSNRPPRGPGCNLLSDFGFNVPAAEAHPANKFMVEWFASLGGSPGSGLRLCSHVNCGRAETRKHEFRRCSICGTVNYCSRACQAIDWKTRHKEVCTPAVRGMYEERDGGGGEVVAEGNQNVVVNT